MKTRIIFALLTVTVSFVSSLEVVAQNAKRDKKAVAMIQNLRVSRLDRRLSTVSFSLWLKKIVGKQKIDWEVNDCGEQDGSGRQKDFPICVQAHAYTIDRIEVTVMVAVGTHKRGIVGKPTVWGIWVQPKDKEAKVLDELSNLVKELARIRRINI